MLLLERKRQPSIVLRMLVVQKSTCFSPLSRDMRKHTFNQLLIALALFDILFIVVSVPVYSFSLFNVLPGNQVGKKIKK